MKLAVIGSGISGLSAAYHFSKNHKVDLFEQDDHFGGHSLTYDIKEEDKVVPVDLGFIVFNEQTYPNLISFFRELDVPFEKSNMSFSVSVKDSNVEYGGSGLNAIFANKKNLFDFEYYKNIYNMLTFIDQRASTDGEVSSEQLSDILTPSNGQAAGLEFFAQKLKGDFTGWVNYTLSYSIKEMDGITSVSYTHLTLPTSDLV